MLVDHHCHLDFPQFVEGRDDLIARAKAAGVGLMVTISTRIRRLSTLLEIAESDPDVYCSVGTHPHQADEELDIPLEEIVRLSRHPKVVAIGEAGLDYFYRHATPEAQVEGFRRHIAAARETGLPLEIIRVTRMPTRSKSSKRNTPRGRSPRFCTASRAGASLP